LPYQPPVSNTFLSEQISNQSAILFSQNQSTSATNQTTLVSFSSQTFAQLLVTSIVLKCFPNYRHINLHLLIRSIKYELMTKHIPWPTSSNHETNMSLIMAWLINVMLHIN
jgi:hypothetical protein